VKITNRKATPVFMLTALAASISASMAVAQDDLDSFMLEEIVVTANKRESSLMETGMSISAYSSESMERLGIDDVNDLSAPCARLVVASNFQLEAVNYESKI